MRNLIATKPLRYATRHLVPGEHFMAKSDRDARILVAIGKAKRSTARAPVKLPPPPDVVLTKVSATTAIRKEAIPDDRASLRAEYKNIFGKSPFMGWDADTLREKIASARNQK